jgi:hypothetical protein
VSAVVSLGRLPRRVLEIEERAWGASTRRGILAQWFFSDQLDRLLLWH